MEKIKKHIANLKVAGKLKLYRMTVLVMTFFLVLVALISTLVIRSNNRRNSLASKQWLCENTYR